MRFLFVLLLAVPALLMFRAIGLFRDWRDVRAGGEPYFEPIDTALTQAEATDVARIRFLRAALAVAASCCFALAGVLLFLWSSGRT